jgi:hypothetical protein
MKYEIVWTEVVSAGLTTIMMITNQHRGVMLVDKQHWCDLCDKTCSHFGFGVVRAGPLGEMAFYPSRSGGGDMDL